MKSLAEAKRRLRIGARVRIENHRFPHLSREATVSRAQGNAVAFDAHASTQGRESWLYWPKIAELRIHDDTVERLGPDGAPAVTLTLLDAEEA